jgi:hypothetical protein
MKSALFVLYIEQIHREINALILSICPRYKIGHIINVNGIKIICCVNTNKYKTLTTLTLCQLPFAQLEKT